MLDVMTEILFSCCLEIGELSSYENPAFFSVLSFHSQRDMRKLNHPRGDRL